MGHLILPFRNETLSGAIERLRRSHGFVVGSLRKSTLSSINESSWGIATKRSGVSLATSESRPADIGKDRENLSELLNLTATVERLIGTLEWFERQPGYTDARVLECHPTTSDGDDANDLVLTDPKGRVVVRVEVCDIVGSGDGNRKERSCIRKLGCTDVVPDDHLRRFIGTSPEFAKRLSRRRRRQVHYAFTRHEAGDDPQTVIMEVVRRGV